MLLAITWILFNSFNPQHSCSQPMSAIDQIELHEQTAEVTLIESRGRFTVIVEELR